MDVKSVDGVLSFRLWAGFSIGSIRNNEAGEIARTVKDRVSMLVRCFQAFHLMIG